MAWDVMSGVTKTAWDVLTGGKSLWDVLSRVSKNGMGCFVLGCFVRLPSNMFITYTCNVLKGYPEL